jgi:hypothetical protein
VSKQQQASSAKICVGRDLSGKWCSNKDAREALRITNNYF